MEERGRYILYRSDASAPRVTGGELRARYSGLEVLEDSEDDKVVLIPRSLVSRLRRETGWDVEEDLQVRPLAAGT